MEYVEKKYVDSVPTHIECILGADIGGTNSNFGIFRSYDHNGLQLILSLHYKSQHVTHFVDIVQHLLSYLRKQYTITIKKSCFAGAGVVSEARDYVKPTNLNWAIDAKEILASTDLQCAYVVNDFEIVGYGIDFIAPDTLAKVNKGTPRVRGNRGIIGAGTGLGKCILVWNDTLGRYVSCPSEGGHADLPAQSVMEFELMDFIRKNEGWRCNISWEDVLSGNGIRRMHSFFKARNHGQGDTNGPHPDDIFNSRTQDKACADTFALYAQLYARCAKNFALDALALNGIYIAGGIASKNLPMFELPVFMDEFINCGKQQELLKDVPVYVITDYNVSLYGAAKYMLLEGICD